MTISGSDGAETLREAGRVLLHRRKGEDPPCYRADTSPPGIVSLEPVAGKIQISPPWSKDRVHSYLTKKARWYRWKSTQEGPVKIPVSDPPGYLCADLVADPPGDLPVLRGLAPGPYLTPAGKPVIKAGYNQETGLYLSGDLRPKITGWTVDKARAYLEDWLTDFPFEAASDRAHALSLYLLPFVRSMIDGPTPLHMIEASTEGTGKGLLLSALLLPGTGSPPELYSLPENRAEVQKLLLSALLSGRPVVAFDNASGEVGGDALERILTSTVSTDRVLGISRTATVENRAIWAMTGNNCTLTRDMVRRTLRIRLDARVADPSSRSGYAHPEILRWTSDRRAELAGLALWAAGEWIRAGRPLPESFSPLASFEDWSRVVSGILGFLRIPGLLQDRAALRAAAAPDEGEWRELLSLWILLHPAPLSSEGYDVSGPLRAGDLTEVAEKYHLLYRYRKGDISSSVASFGIALSKQLGRVYVLKAEDFAEARKEIRKAEPGHMGGADPLPGDYRIERRTAHRQGVYTLVHRSRWAE